MAGQSFKFRKGPINLSDDDGALVRLVPVRKRFSMFTAEIHGLMVCTSSLGIAFLLAAYATSDTENAIKRWPEESAMVAISLLIPIIWSGLHVLLFQNYSEGFLGLVCTAQDIIMIIALISFPVVCCSSLTDAGIQGVCDYLMIAGLVCAFLVAFFHLIKLSVRVISFIIDLAKGPDSTPLAKGLYKKGYSTEIAIYITSACLSTIGFSMMIWAYDFHSTFAKENYHNPGIHIPHNFAGFDALTILHFIVLLWLLVNIYSMILSSQALPRKLAAVYELCLGTSILGVSIRCLIFLHNLNEVCPNDSHCTWMWHEVKPKHIAAIALGFIVGFIHLAISLNRLRHHLHSLRPKARTDTSELVFLRNHTWADDEIMSIFRVKGLTDEARDNIVSVLYEIRSEDVSTGNSVERRFRDSIDGSGWSDAQLAVLCDSLHCQKEYEVKN